MIVKVTRVHRSVCESRELQSTRQSIFYAAPSHALGFLSGDISVRVPPRAKPGNTSKLYDVIFGIPTMSLAAWIAFCLPGSGRNIKLCFPVCGNKDTAFVDFVIKDLTRVPLRMDLTLV